MNKNDIISALEPIVNLFNDLQISYYVCGSIASSSYGISRSTQDIDLVSDLKLVSINTLVDKLKSKYFIDAGMIEEAIKSKSSFNMIHLETMMKIDVFILKNELYHKSTEARKIQDKLDFDTESIDVFLISPEDLILSKILWFKSGNSISERQWLDILGVLKIQNNKLDKKYLIKWASDLDISSLLEKAFSEAQ